MTTLAANSVGARRSRAVDALAVENQKDQNFIHDAEDRLVNDQGLSSGQKIQLMEQLELAKERVRKTDSAIQSLSGQPLDKPFLPEELSALLGR